ncbi:MAG: hypothetical protein ACR2RF_16730 [Geminicoccaceae bacterium]
MPRSRRSYAYLISCRLGDAQAGSICMTFACAYAQGEGDGDRKLVKASLVQARRYDFNQVKVAERVEALYDTIDQHRGKSPWDHWSKEKPDFYGLGCVIDNSRNIAFREVMEDMEFSADLVIVRPGDEIKETAAETIVERELIISNLANRFGKGHIALQPDQGGEHDIPVLEIKEALQGAQARPTVQHKAVTVLPELDPRDDIALCLGLGVLWSSYMAPESENWLLHQAMVQRPSYDWVV